MAREASSSRRKSRSVEDMLAALASHGVRLAAGWRTDDLFSEWSCEQVEDGGFEMMLVALGEELLHPETLESQGFLSNDVWHFDSECIDGPGAYAAIVRRIVMLSHGDLSLEPVEDHLDVEAALAWVEWTVAGEVQRHDLQVQYDWVDPRIFGLLNQQLAAAGSRRRIHAAALGQDSLILCCDEDRRKALSDLTGLPFGKPADKPA